MAKPIEDLSEKALMVIEGMLLATGEGVLLPTGREYEMLQACYKFAHVGLGRCKNPHKDWVDDLNYTYDQLKKDKVI